MHTHPEASVLPANALPPIILTVDIGTSSLRCMLFDLHGRHVLGSLARRSLSLTTAADGTAVMQVGPLLESLWDCLDETVAWSLASRLEISAVSMCTFVSNVCGVDQTGQVVTPLYTYADTRAASDAAALKSQLDENAVHQRTGCLIHPSYLTARFMWLARAQPGLFHAAARWMSLGEYVFQLLFGGAAVSYSVASWTGLLDRTRLEWDDELLQFLPVGRSQLSELVDVSRSFSGLCEPFARRWPSLRRIPWFPAVGDGAAANLGSGCVAAGRMALTMGTSTALRVVVPGQPPQVPAGLWCYRVDAVNSLLGGALSEGGSIFDWLVKTLRIDIKSDLDAALSSLPPDGHGLTFLPLLAGERSPGWRGEARGGIAGISLSTSPLELLRAGLEGVAYRIALVYRLFVPQLSDEPQVVVSGGALLNSPAWAQIVADVLAVPLSISAVEESSARGAAMLGLRSMGAVASLQDFPYFTRQVLQPDSSRRERYQRAILRQQSLYESLAEDPAFVSSAA